MNQRHLAGKFDNHRHSTVSFSENDVVAGTSYEVLEVLSFCDRERAKPSPKKITSLLFKVKNNTMKLSRLNIFLEYLKKLKVKSSTRPRSQPKALYYLAASKFVRLGGAVVPFVNGRCNV